MPRYLVRKHSKVSTAERANHKRMLVWSSLSIVLSRLFARDEAMLDSGFAYVRACALNPVRVPNVCSVAEFVPLLA